MKYFIQIGKCTFPPPHTLTFRNKSLTENGNSIEEEKYNQTIKENKEEKKIELKNKKKKKTFGSRR